MICSHSCGLEVLSELDQSIVPSHYLFLRSNVVDVIVSEVLLPGWVVIWLVEDAVVARSQTVINLLICDPDYAYKIPEVMVLLEPSLIVLLLHAFELFLVSFSSGSYLHHHF